MIARAFRLIRECHGMTLEQLSDELIIEADWIAKFETDETTITDAIAVRYFDFFTSQKAKEYAKEADLSCIGGSIPSTILARNALKIIEFIANVSMSAETHKIELCRDAVVFAQKTYELNDLLDIANLGKQVEDRANILYRELKLLENKLGIS